jgi:glycosidase/MoaA/NifB/PqqE/SkfB family radical SAM enzyme
MARAPLALPLGVLRHPELAEDCRPVCLRFPGAPPHSEVYGELPHWQKPRALSTGLDGVPEVVVPLRPGLYSYKLRTPDGTWHLHDQNPRTRASEGLRNNVLSLGGCDEPILHVPQPPFVFLREDGLLTVRAALRKTAGDSLQLRFRDLESTHELAMARVGEEDEHVLLEAQLPLSSSRVDYWFRLPSGRLVGGPAEQALRASLRKPEQPSWWRDAVLYSIFVDRFRRGDGQPWPLLLDERARRGGDLDGIRAALPYLSDLGVTVLHLTPIWQSRSAHRYDSIDPLTVDPALGGEVALRRLLDEAERLGLRILLDITLTHVSRDFLPFCDVRLRGPESPYAGWFHFHRWPFSDGPSPGYEHYQHGQWDEPLLRTDHPDVATYLLRVLLHYLSLGVAGFRLDSAADVPVELLSLLAQGVRAVRKDALLLGELTVDNLGHYVGRGLDCATDFSLQHGLVEWLCEKRSATEFAALASRRAFVRGPSQAALGMTASHDLPRLRSLVDERQAQLGHLVSLLRPEVPMVYYGDELGLHSDEPVRSFEDVWPDRLPMPWSQVEAEPPTLRLFRELLAMRQTYPALRRGDCQELTRWDQPEVLIFRRQLREEFIEVYAHGREGFVELPLLPDAPQDAVVLLALGEAELDSASGTIRLGPYAALVLQRQPPSAVQALARQLTEQAAERVSAAFRQGQTAGLLLPSKLYLTATERCNLRCQHCITLAPEKTAQKTARTMPPWVLDALDEALQAASYFGFSHGGESLVAPHFYDILRRIQRAKRGRPYDVHLLSNGMLLTGEAVAELSELGVTSLAVSLDGGTAATNDAIRAGCDFERVLHHLRHAVSLRRELRIDLRIGVSTVLLRQNVAELPLLAQQVCDLGLDWLKVEEGYPVNVFSAESLLRPAATEVQRALATARTLCESSGVIWVDHLQPPCGCPCQAAAVPGLSEFRATDDFANRAVFRPCRAAWEVACVDPDGTVHAGDYGASPLGSLAEQPFVELWNGREAKAQRRDALALIAPELRRNCPH